MSHSNRSILRFRSLKSLPIGMRQSQIISITNETPLCTCKEVTSRRKRSWEKISDRGKRSWRKASYTLEAVVVFPLVAVFLVMILFLFRVIQVERDIQVALYQTGRKVAVQQSLGYGEVAEFALAQYYFQQEIKENEYIQDYVKGQNLGIVLLCDREETEYIHLKASYTVEFPISLFSWDGLSMTAQCKQHYWNGRKISEEEGEEYVYITPEGEVYHLTDQCSYLDLSIYRTEIEEISVLRNLYGQKYYSCERCADKNENAEFVYVTYYGTAYHTSLDCSALKRTVQKVLKSEVSDRRICSKCGKNAH